MNIVWQVRRYGRVTRNSLSKSRVAAAVAAAQSNPLVAITRNHCAIRPYTPIEARWWWWWPQMELLAVIASHSLPRHLFRLFREKKTDCSRRHHSRWRFCLDSSDLIHNFLIFDFNRWTVLDNFSNKKKVSLQSNTGKSGKFCPGYVYRGGKTIMFCLFPSVSSISKVLLRHSLFFNSFAFRFHIAILLKSKHTNLLIIMPRFVCHF